MPENSPLTDQRRFSSILVVHPKLNSFDGLESLLGRRLAASTSVEIGAESWSVHRAELLAARSYYPETVIPASTRERDGGFAHEIYVGRITANNADPSFLLIASPYVRLLQQLAGQLSRAVGPPAMQYLAVDMRSTYRLFRTPRALMSATRVTLQMLNQPGLELVALSGRNPLDSELHTSIEHVTAPYAVRVEIAGPGGGRSRVNVDRHGNIWWYQTDEGKLAAPLDLLRTLAEAQVFHSTRSLPLDRAKDDEDAT